MRLEQIVAPARVDKLLGFLARFHLFPENSKNQKAIVEESEHKGRNDSRQFKEKGRRNEERKRE